MLRRLYTLSTAVNAMKPQALSKATTLIAATDALRIKGFKIPPLSLSLILPQCLCPICFSFSYARSSPGTLKLNEHHNGLQREAVAQSALNLNPQRFHGALRKESERKSRNLAPSRRGRSVDWSVDPMTVQPANYNPSTAL